MNEDEFNEQLAEEASYWEENCPPPEDSYVESYEYYDDSNAAPSSSNSQTPSNPLTSLQKLSDLIPWLLDRLISVTASLQGKSPELVSSVLTQLRASSEVLNVLKKDQQDVINSVVEVLSFEVNDAKSGFTLDLQTLHILHLKNEQTQDFVQQAAQRAALTAAEDPTKALVTAQEHVQKARSLLSARALTRTLTDKKSTAAQVEAFKDVVSPTVTQVTVRDRLAKSAAELESEQIQREGKSSLIRISSGLPSLDASLTMPEHVGVKGWLAPGQIAAIAGGTGHGKSAFIRPAILSAAIDLVYGWGMKNAKVFLAFTEEDDTIIRNVMQLNRGQRYHHLAKNIVLVDVGSSRKNLVHAFYEQVMDAEDQALKSGQPITEFMPWVVALDYLGAISEAGENPYTTAVENTANLAMRGFAKCDPDELARYSGVDYRVFSGRNWPEGLGDHQIATIMANQFRQFPKNTLYIPDSTLTPLLDFTSEEAPWELQEGDFYLPKQVDVAGSSVIINNVTTLLILHRSRPKGGVNIDPVTGRSYVSDARARIIVDKARTGTRLKVIPFDFDSNVAGTRGRWWDNRAIKAIERGLLHVPDYYLGEDDPITPLRPVRSPLARIKY